MISTVCKADGQLATDGLLRPKEELSWVAALLQLININLICIYKHVNFCQKVQGRLQLWLPKCADVWQEVQEKLKYLVTFFSIGCWWFFCLVVCYKSQQLRLRDIIRWRKAHYTEKTGVSRQDMNKVKSHSLPMLTTEPRVEMIQEAHKTTWYGVLQ